MPLLEKPRDVLLVCMKHDKICLVLRAFTEAWRWSFLRITLACALLPTCEIPGPIMKYYPTTNGDICKSDLLHQKDQS